jgi:hypothetical protein
MWARSPAERTNLPSSRSVRTRARNSAALYSELAANVSSCRRVEDAVHTIDVGRQRLSLVVVCVPVRGQPKLFAGRQSADFEYMLGDQSG